MWVLWCALAVVAAALAFRGFLVEPWRIEHRVVELELAGLPRWMEGARILFLSDLHTIGRGFRELFIADLLARRPPDLVFVTGDLVSNPRGVDTALDLLGSLRPRFGVFFVRGNNEVEELDDDGAFLDRLRGLGWNVLMNQAVSLSPAGVPPAPGDPDVWVAGVDDPNNLLDDVPATLASVPAGAFTILLSHTPETLPEARRAGVRLVLAGHTHGGQVRVPGHGALWSDTPRVATRYAAGVFREGDTTMVVTRGVGWSIMPLRLFCPPEVLELSLRRLPAGQAPGA